MTSEASRTEKHIAKVIRCEVGFINGWLVSDDTLAVIFRRASKKVLRYLKERRRKR